MVHIAERGIAQSLSQRPGGVNGFGGIRLLQEPGGIAVQIDEVDQGEVVFVRKREGRIYEEPREQSRA